MARGVSAYHCCIPKIPYLIHVRYWPAPTEWTRENIRNDTTSEACDVAICSSRYMHPCRQSTKQSIRIVRLFLCILAWIKVVFSLYPSFEAGLQIYLLYLIGACFASICRRSDCSDGKDRSACHSMKITLSIQHTNSINHIDKKYDIVFQVYCIPSVVGHVSA